MYEFHVEGMSCGGCVKGVTKAVQAVDSNATVDVDLKSKKVRVDSRASLEGISSSIIDAGYPVTEGTAI